MKKILIISGFFIILFLISPSISAIQSNVVEDSIFDDCKNQIKVIDIKELKDIADNEELPDHPFLFYFVMLVFYLRFFRFLLYMNIAIDIDWPGRVPEITIKHPIMVICGIILYFRTEFWMGFWANFAEYIGWNWSQI